MERPSWAPDGVDLDRPSVARVYDYYLGGSHNFAVDRAFAEQVLQVVPDAAGDHAGTTGRSCAGRCATCVAQGIDQFLDLGSGIPTVGNVHEVAQAVNPAARVVYVDLDPVAVAHSRAILAGDDRRGGRRRPTCATPDEVLANPQVRGAARPDPAGRGAAGRGAALRRPTSRRRPSSSAGYAAAAGRAATSRISHASLATGRSPRRGAGRDRSTADRQPGDDADRSEEIAALFGDLDTRRAGRGADLPLWRPDPADRRRARSAAADSGVWPGWGAHR